MGNFMVAVFIARRGEVFLSWRAVVSWDLGGRQGAIVVSYLTRFLVTIVSRKFGGQVVL